MVNKHCGREPGPVVADAGGEAGWPACPSFQPICCSQPAGDLVLDL